MSKKVIKVTQLNGNPQVDVWTKEEHRWYGKVERTWFTFLADWHLLVTYADGSTHNIVVKAGFDTNGASVPMLCRGLISAQRLLKPGFAHDWLYTTGEVSREQADEIFRMACLCLAKVARWRADGAWAAVRVGGKGNYKR